MTAAAILDAIIPTLSHSNQDIRNAALKILLDVHKLTGCVQEQHLASLPDKIREIILEKIYTVT